MLVTRSKLAKNDAVVEYFCESLPLALQKDILRLPTQPTDLDNWYKWAIQLHNNFVRMRSAIAKTQARTSQTPRNPTTPPRPTGTAPRRFYFEPKQTRQYRDPNAMDIDFMSTERRTEMMQKGLCFKCGLQGHRANDPTFHPQTPRGSYIPLKRPEEKQKMTGKQLHAHIKGLMAQMDKEEADSFFNDAANEGF
jgi:hypothetical protein